MSQHPYAEFPPDIRVKSSRLQPFVSSCYRHALQQLGKAYADGHPAAILVGEGQVGPGLVVDTFLGKLEDDVNVVRVSGPCPDATTCMRQIVSDVGFESRKMSLSDLEDVLEMFLVYQRSKKLRTIISFENSQSSDWTVLDVIRRLIELELREKFGLLIIKSSLSDGISSLHDPLLDLNCSHGIQRITLSPLKLSETRDFVSKFAEGPASDQVYLYDAGQIFEFFAVTLIHEFSEGVPELVEKLTSKCMRLMRDAGDPCVSTDTVRAAAKLLGLEAAMSGPMTDMPANVVHESAIKPGRLIVQSKGDPDQDIALDQQCILIGRDPLCAISITGLRVSRYHGFFSFSEHGLQFVDLGSTNGSYVNGKKSERCTLSDNDIVTIGNTRIRYVAGSEQLPASDGTDITDSFGVFDAPVEPSITKLGRDFDLFRT